MKLTKLPMLILAIFVLASFNIPVSANSVTTAKETTNLSDLASFKQLPNGDIEIIPYDTEKYIEAANLQKPFPDAKLESLKIVTLPETLEFDQQQDSTVQPFALPGSLYLKITSISEGTGGLIAQNSNTCYSTNGCSSLEVEISVNTSVNSEFTSTLGAALPENIVSAGVGYTIGTGVSIQNSSRYSENNVPYGKTLYIQAYPRLDITGFEVWKVGWFSDSLAGTGSAWKAKPNQIQVASWKNY